jgi:signal transduction histidine kinase
MARFTVDTHLFRELGAHLVGRDSTALVELVKNSYDADATRVSVHGEALEQAGGRIVVEDDGNGMTPALFELGFLRVASRLKETDERRSLRYGRRLTGAKGIGRLAAHKLSSVLQVESMPRDDAYEGGDTLFGVKAMIDWEAVEKHVTLDDVGDSVVVRRLRFREGRSGTTLYLDPLRRPFDSAELAVFVSEVTTFEPPPLLLRALPHTVVPESLLFDEPVVRDTSRRDPGMALEFSGEFDVGEEHWQLLAERMHWVLEIRASRRSRRVSYVIAPTLQGVRRNPYAERREFTAPHPSPATGPGFYARILVSETGRFGRGEASDFARRNTGIRVYIEGFRVLPYGDPGDDWLNLDADYTRRRQAFALDDLNGPFDAPVERETFFRLSNKNFVGAVFLTEREAGGLQMLINREGFLPDPTFATLRQLVRQGVDLTARVRAAADLRHREAREAERAQSAGEDDEDTSDSTAPSTPSGRLEAAADALFVSVQAERAALTRDFAADVEASLAAISRELERLREDQAVFRTLATLGTQFATFVHETNLLLAQARVVQELVHAMDSDAADVELVEASDELVASLDRQASFLTDIVGADARRTRRPLDPRDRLDSALRLVGGALERRSISLVVDIPERVRTRPMFPAELTAILTNALTNAAKAAGHGGTIRVTARALRGRGGTEIRVENTGTAVDLADAERWFAPFESTTAEVDEVLGLGLGLGLPLIRRLAAEYGGVAMFTDPSPGFATALMVRIPRGGHQ